MNTRTSDQISAFHSLVTTTLSSTTTTSTETSLDSSFAESSNNTDSEDVVSKQLSFPQCDAPRWNNDAFDLGTALFAAGLAFDTYVEPPANSSRWERGVSL